MHIILIGGPASGKTAIGKLLAKARGYSFFDTDNQIEKEACKKITEIFADEGETGFRAMETLALKKCLMQDNCVISTGGGIIKQSENREILAHFPWIFYLDVSVAKQLERTLFDHTRPLLQGKNKREILEKLYAERDPLYKAIAKYTVNADGSESEIVNKIICDLKDTNN